MPSPSHRLLAALAIWLVVAGAVRADKDFSKADIDALLVDSLKKWHVPGLAVAIVHEDEVIYLKGHGVREKGHTEPVTPDTLFPIASLTKAFTATTLGILVDEGKVEWDDSVRKHVPFFRLSDPLADRDATLRDLLCHRTGLPRQDLLWYRAPWSLKETIRRAGRLEPASSFRSSYLYNNIAYITAGFAITSASGKPWDEFMKDRLFTPLGMKNVVFTRAAALSTNDHATPHTVIDGAVTPIDWYDDDKQVRASGSIKTNVRDLTAWLRLQLNGGTFEGKRLISAGTLAETHTPQIIVRPDHNGIERDRYETTEATQISYGLGWRILDYRGQPMIEHGGALDGFRARLMLLPKQKLGVVLLLNLGETNAVTAIGNTLLDHLLKLKPKDWHAHYRKRLQEAEEERKAATKRFQASRRPGTKPSLELDGYTGTYEDAAFGTVEIVRKKESLQLVWSTYRVPLRHFHCDTFALEKEREQLGDAVTFELGEDGEVATLRAFGRTFRKGK
jgi:CubicO group peptidase (beta-lactamase class C family)